MPQIIAKGIEKENLRKLSKNTAAKLSEISNTPVEHFTYEFVDSTFIVNGEYFEMYPLIEIKLFDRGDIIHGKFANIITEELNSLGYDQVEIFFTKIEFKDYYENGEHY